MYISCFFIFLFGADFYARQCKNDPLGGNNATQPPPTCVDVWEKKEIWCSRLRSSHSNSVTHGKYVSPRQLFIDSPAPPPPFVFFCGVCLLQFVLAVVPQWAIVFDVKRLFRLSFSFLCLCVSLLDVPHWSSPVLCDPPDTERYDHTHANRHTHTHSYTTFSPIKGIVRSSIFICFKIKWKITIFLFLEKLQQFID